MMSEKKLNFIDKNHVKLKDSPRFWVNFVNSLTGFKSANLLATVSEDGVENLSIVSSAVHLGAHPPLIGLVIRPHSEESPRHSLENIESTGFYSLNHVRKEIYKKAHQCSARYKREQSEFKEVGLTPEYKNKFNAPYVKESLMQMGLKHRRSYLIEENQTHFVVGELVEVYTLEEALREDGSLNLNSLETVLISGLDTYYEANKLSRLSYAKPDKELKEI